jgi:hypothetical protein
MGGKGANDKGGNSASHVRTHRKVVGARDSLRVLDADITAGSNASRPTASIAVDPRNWVATDN